MTASTRVDGGRRQSYRRFPPRTPASDFRRHYQIVQQGEKARGCLSPGRRGKVLASFSKSIYLLADREIVWIADDTVPMHRRSAQVSGSLPRPAVGADYFVDGRTLFVEPIFECELRESGMWTEPDVIEPDTAVNLAELSIRIEVLFDLVDSSNAKGFGYLIPVLRGLFHGSSTVRLEDHDPVLEFAGPLIMDIVRACMERRMANVSRSVKRLVGLGEGLTPSGDDFLGGLLFSRYMMKYVYDEPEGLVSDADIRKFETLTNTISFTLMKDMSEGHGIEPLYGLVNALCGEMTVETMNEHISRLTCIGHSSGWDLLTGLLTGLLSVYRNPRNSSNS